MNRYIYHPVCLAIALSLFGAVPRARAGDPQPWESPPAAAQTVLRIARSHDGADFQDTGNILVARAAAPDIEVLPDGEVIAIFDRAADADPERTVLQWSRSRDNGRTWSSPRRIHVRRGHRSLRDAHRADLVVADDGLRLYFATKFGGRRSTHTRHRRILIASALGRHDALDFKLDPVTRIPVSGEHAHPVVGVSDGYTHLFAIVQPGSRERHRTRLDVEHFLSRDGRRFAQLRRSDGHDGLTHGSIVKTRQGLRHFTANPAGIVSFRSRDGRRWNREPGLRLDHGWDPAVARRNDGSYLMLFCDALDDELPETAVAMEPQPQPQLELEEGAWEDMAGVEPQDIMLDEPSEADHTVELGAAAANGDATPSEVADAPHPANGAPEEPDADEPAVAVVTPPAETTEKRSDTRASASSHAADPPPGQQPDGRVSLEEWKQSADGLEHWDPLWSDGFAPLPDFQGKINYFAWYRNFALTNPADNAYPAYESLMPDPRHERGAQPDWPAFKDMFNSDNYDGPPGPWDPAEHPTRNVTTPEIQNLLERYRQASRHSGYAAPPITTKDISGARDDDELLLAEIVLPFLSPHRSLAKATLTDAWRQNADGEVSPQRMLDAFETALRAASHLSQGATLIEELVGTVMRNLAYNNARWALKHDVFSGDDLQRALDTLQQHDRSYKDPADALRGEHAFAMDAAQYLFSPPTPDGTPKINPQRVDRLAELLESHRNGLDAVKHMPPDDAYASIDAFDAYHRQLTEMFRIGYPQVRAVDVDAFTHEAMTATPLTELLLPSFSRYYQLKTRIETARRATQLTYAVHIFNDRNGRWPASLAELPAEFGEEMRTDPFTGSYFGYRLTDDGPLIYSLSENALDDGGIHSPRWDDEVTNDAGSDDHVFWPPQPD